MDRASSLSIGGDCRVGSPGAFDEIEIGLAIRFDAPVFGKECRAGNPMSRFPEAPLCERFRRRMGEEGDQHTRICTHLFSEDHFIGYSLRLFACISFINAILC